MLKGKAVASLPMEVKVPVNLYINKMYLLITATFCKGKDVGEFVIHYKDGKIARIPLIVGENIKDWWNPKVLPHARVAWMGNSSKHSPVGIYMIKWINPFKTNRVKTIKFIAEDKTGPQLVWIAATVEQTNPARFTELGAEKK